MRIRIGFISNSSSSSFIVKHNDFNFKKKKCIRLLDKKTIKKLEKFGFFKTSLFNTIFMEFASNDEIKKMDEDFWNYGFRVICNQHKPLYFLLKNKIPFEAVIHYGYSHIFYDGGDYFFEIQNYGLQYNPNLQSKKELLYNEPFKKVKVKSWLKKEEKWRKEDED